MKKILLFIFTMIIVKTVYAEDLYVVEFNDSKEQVSSYIVQSIDEIDTTNAYVLVTAEEYALLSDGSKWEENTTAWLKKKENEDKVDLAITNKPKTDKEIIADLEARLKALEDAKAVSP